MKRLWTTLGLGWFAVSAQAAPAPQSLATFEEVPVGVAASSGGRIFLAFSRAIDPLESISVAELKNGKAVPFPAGFEQGDGAPGPKRLLSVQALTVDAQDRLWILDTGKVGTNRVEAGTPKLVAVDLKTQRIVKQVPFPASVAGPTSFLNDLRVDLKRNPEGVVYLTDASAEGPNGIVVVDIATGQATRKLNDHPSTRPDPKLTLQVEGQPLLQKKGPALGTPFSIGADGIALSADGSFLYYSPLTSHHLYRVRTDALLDAKASEQTVAQAVEDLGDKGFASDGLFIDAQDRLYATNFEGHALHRRSADGKTWEVLSQDAALAWPDTLAMLPDGRLLVTVTQIHRSPRFRAGDGRERPFRVLALPTDAQLRVP